MKEFRLVPPDYPRILFGVTTLALAICLTVGTLIYQHPSDFLCAGRLSAGFPAAFICDASGESPLSSVGKIEWADANSVNLLGSSVDVLFYLSLSWSLWFGGRRLLRRDG